MECQKLTEKIIGCAMRVHRTLGPGFLESVYQNALAHELGKSGLRCQTHIPLKVTCDNICVGDFVADLLVEDIVLIENKAILNLAPAHEAQIVNYPTATGVEIGLLLNFGGERLQFKRKRRTYRPKSTDEIIL